ncbi:tRNA a64-2 -o-ribosylphosphate transferase [Phlyctema vagabunda]|uniref:tRNA a64-2 -o-ribosylphosphate transferase n=1 Tax=Phlyctema vagabunda TaxID=108571 RepID=A0ABR4PWZ8_9HELO
MASTATYADLVFSEQANHNFSKTLGDIKRSTLSISNRLRSIQEDAVFAERAAQAYRRPLIANERCGSWYIRPNHKAGSAYFKSTDGHTGVWKFSSRRLNLHLLEIIGKNDGCIIVDSTRRGKRMPDALSKTIPIWCSVLNHLLFPSNPQFHSLYTPPQVVSESEHSQIAALLPSFVLSLEALCISPDELRSHLRKPLRPLWITPESELLPSSTVFEDYHPVFCCTVSRRVTGGEVSEGGYIQGAGDDTENWAHGLTPTLFWENQQRLCATLEHDLPDLIETLVSCKASGTLNGPGMKCVKPASRVFFGSLSSPKMVQEGVCLVTLLSNVTKQSTWRKSATQLEIGLGPSKLGSRNLRSALPVIISFVQSVSEIEHCEDKIFAVACESGKDFSVGVALALLCLFFDDKGCMLPKRNLEELHRPQITKTYIRQRLGWISNAMPDINPSRSTLQSVNSFLMDRP